MCFKENTSLFKAINWFFAVFHLAFLLACVVVILQKDGPLTLYYKIYLIHDESVDVYPIYSAIVAHVAGLVFHFIFAIMGNYIVDIHFSKSYTNPIRWVQQFFVDGASLVGLMFIHGFDSVETIILIITLYAAIIGFCYFQDQYLSDDHEFNPPREPHTFAFPLHIMMILMIVAKSTDHINDEKSTKIAFVTLVSLTLTLVSYVIQRLQINYKSDTSSKKTAEIEDEETDEESKIPDLGDMSTKMDMIDKICNEIRRGIQYEIFHYTNSILFAMTVTWFIINITRTDQVLN